MPAVARPEDEDLAIVTGGRKLAGWKAVNVFRSVERMPSGFALETTELDPAEPGVAVAAPGESAEIYLGEELVLTGWVDTYTVDYDSGEHRVQVQGRSLTEDLVDCSALPPNNIWEIFPQSLSEAAHLVIDPFGIGLSLPDGDVTIDSHIPGFPINPGMTCAQLLTDVAEATQRLMWDDAQGRLVFSKVGTQRAGSALVEGENCEIGRSRLSFAQAHSLVVVIGQKPLPSPDGPSDKIYQNEVGRSETNGKIGRFRPLLVPRDNIGIDPEKWPKQWADWLLAREYGRGFIAEITVTGWRDGSGALWTPNTVVNVACPRLKMEQDLVIAQARWMRGPNGTQTALTCMPAEALAPPPYLFTMPDPG